MVVLNMESCAVAVALNAGATREHRPSSSWRHCLVASPNARHRDLLAASAARWGWEVTVCGDVRSAQRCIAGLGAQLSFVDVSGEEGLAFRKVVTQSAESKSLVVVCGSLDDSQEEIWARQLGIWFYLPGLRHSGSIDLLCRDALSIVSRRQQSVGKTVPVGKAGLSATLARFRGARS